MAAAASAGRARRTVRALALTALLAGAAGSDVVHAQTPTGDADAKAKFTITVARFVQWPAPATESDAVPLRICVLHNSPAVDSAFAMLGGQRVAGRPVSVLPNPRDRRDCGVLFVDASAGQGGAEALAAVAGVPSLTIGAVDGFLSQGGMIELVNVDDALRFDVNLKVLRSARLDMSSRALKLARQVRQ